MTNLVTKATELVYKMDNDQLNQLVEAVKLKRTHLSRQAVQNFLVGDIVSFTQRDGNQVSGRINKINRKYIIVRESASGTQWRVPGTMLTKLGVGA